MLWFVRLIVPESGTDDSFRRKSSLYQGLWHDLDTKRRGRDSNPRYTFRRKHEFQSCAFNHSATSPGRAAAGPRGGGPGIVSDRVGV